MPGTLAASKYTVAFAGRVFDDTGLLGFSFGAVVFGFFAGFGFGEPAGHFREALAADDFGCRRSGYAAHARFPLAPRCFGARFPAAGSCGLPFSCHVLEVCFV